MNPLETIIQMIPHLLPIIKQSQPNTTISTVLNTTSSVKKSQLNTTSSDNQSQLTLLQQQSINLQKQIPKLQTKKQDLEKQITELQEKIRILQTQVPQPTSLLTSLTKQLTALQQTVVRPPAPARTRINVKVKKGMDNIGFKNTKEIQKKPRLYTDVNIIENTSGNVDDMLKAINTDPEIVHDEEINIDKNY